jgi:hypothetical protein
MTIQGHSTTGHSELLWADITNIALLMALVVIVIALAWQYIQCAHRLNYGRASAACKHERVAFAAMHGPDLL